MQVINVTAIDLLCVGN